MHLTGDVSLGQLLTILSVLTGFLGINRKFNIVLYQHKLLWEDFELRSRLRRGSKD